MQFEPIKAFNFRVEVPDGVSEEVGDLFTLSIESAFINFTAKTGRIDVRDFSDSGQKGIDLIRFYMRGVIPEIRVNLLDPFGNVCRTYVLLNNTLSSATVNMSNGPAGRRKHVTNSLFFDFETMNVVPGTHPKVPEGVYVLDLDYTKDEGPAEIMY